MFDNVIVGVDGEDGGRDAIALAKVLLSEGGRLTLANVYPGDAYVWRGGSPAYQLVEENESAAILEHARVEAGVEAGVKRIGDPSVGKGLHVPAEDVGADLLVIGSSRRGLVGRVTLGDDTRVASTALPAPSQSPPPATRPSRG